MPSFRTPFDIGNRALQIIGVPDRLTTTFTGFKGAVEIGSCYDQLRENELSKNLWRFATRSSILRPVSVDTLVWTPPTYDSGTTYGVGSVVVSSNQFWQSKVASNLGNTPDVGSYWRRYFGPEVADLYDSGTSYFAGEIVVVPAAWSSGTTYSKNAVVRSSTTWYVSLADSNLNNAVTDTAYWAEWATDGRSADGWGMTANETLVPITYPGTPIFYLSLVNANADNPLDSGAQWLEVDGTGVALSIVYPLGAGPSQSPTTANIYRLPYAYLTRAPTSPKGNANTWLGMPHANRREDYVLEDDYIISSRVGPILIRCVVDFIDVPDMNSLFCEGLAGRIADTICESVTQSTEKKALARAAYNDAMRAARQNNAIEIGPVDPDLSDLIACRS